MTLLERSLNEIYPGEQSVSLEHTCLILLNAKEGDRMTGSSAPGFLTKVFHRRVASASVQLD